MNEQPNGMSLLIVVLASLLVACDQSFIIPDFAPNVTEQIIEVDGALVKCTKGVQFEYEKYVPPIDSSRNYTPRPIRGILAGRDHGA
jgi:hypothetical protein